ncbi:hypothetical protein PAPHI01_0982 [Pancytospora philotis]|nr:hypothetical protein PAPHI01_0982 [Pancytospora philotis]
MRGLLEHTVAELLRTAGFERVSRQALETLLVVFEDRLCAVLNATASRAAFAGRPSASVLDIMNTITAPTGFSCQIGTDRRNPAELRRWAFGVAPGLPANYEGEQHEDQAEWVSPLSTRVEKFIHIYDFMPSFPPIHTFRLTAAKVPASKNHSSRVKNRLEQSLKSESNMMKLIKSSGSLPSYINFLYKAKK